MPAETKAAEAETNSEKPDEEGTNAEGQRIGGPLIDARQDSKEEDLHKMRGLGSRNLRPVFNQKWSRN